jgi:cephalosporin hydroxylase
MTSESEQYHEAKNIISKKEFIEINQEAASSMSQDEHLQKKSREVLIEADKYRWIHQTTWLGEPLLNLPQDMFEIQNIIWQTKPDYIVEIGCAWGGSLLFLATMLEIVGGKKVIGVDIFIPDDLRTRLSNQTALSERLELIEGSSVDSDTFQNVKNVIGDTDRVLVILDSFHSEKHVLEELGLYSSLVGEGQYIICGDTIVEYIPKQFHRERPWGPGNSPATALQKFLAKNDRFEVDSEIDARLLFSCHPGGYLKALK